MSLSNLYFRGCFEEPSDDQKEAIVKTCGIGDVIDKSCSKASINTCSMSIKQLFDEHPIYNPQKGLYKSWGDVEFPWQISNLTPNLLLSETEDKWGISQYRSVVAYREDSTVLLIEDDGYKVGLYKAKEDILAITGAFDYSKWDEVCHVETTEPAGVPSVEELLALYNLYELKFFDTEWGKYQAKWQDFLKCLTLQDCLDQNLSFEEIAGCSVKGPSVEMRNCLDFGSSDEWSNARIRRNFLYRAGDMVLVPGECGDTLCLYIALVDIPATSYIWDEYSGKDFAEFMYLSAANRAIGQKTKTWQRIYCSLTGHNKCLEYQRRKESALGYDVVQIGSLEHYVEVPAPYRLKSKSDSEPLDLKTNTGTPRRVLTDREIYDLDHDSYPYTTEC